MHFLIQVSLAATAALMAWYFWPDPFSELITGIAIGAPLALALVIHDLRDTGFIDFRRYRQNKGS